MFLGIFFVFKPNTRPRHRLCSSRVALLYLSKSVCGWGMELLPNEKPQDKKKRCTSTAARRFCTEKSVGHTLPCAKSFYGNPPQLFFNEIAGFETRPRSYFLKYGFDVPLQTRKCRQDICFIPSFLASSSHETFVKQMAGYRGGVNRRISPQPRIFQGLARNKEILKTGVAYCSGNWGDDCSVVINCM